LSERTPYICTANIWFCQTFFYCLVQLQIPKMLDIEVSVSVLRLLLAPAWDLPDLGGILSHPSVRCSENAGYSEFRTITE